MNNQQPQQGQQQQAPDPGTTAESQLHYYSTYAIPNSLQELANKHGYVSQVIQYCEGAYFTQDKNEIERQTKNYLTVRDQEVTSLFSSQIGCIGDNCEGYPTHFC